MTMSLDPNQNNLIGQPPPEQNQQVPAPVTINMPPPAPTPEPPMSSEQLTEMFNAERERVRKEEKDKLYPQLQALNEQVNALTREREERLAAEQAEQQRLAEEARLRQEEEMSARERLEQYKTEQDQRFAQLEEERNREAALRQKEAEFFKISQYRLERLAQEADAIAPQFVDFVNGSNEEQIDQAIETVKAKTAEIVAQVQQVQVGQRREIVPPISGMPPVDNPGGGGEQQRTLSPAEIQDADRGIRSIPLSAFGGGK